jgi:sarcosine oxidase
MQTFDAIVVGMGAHGSAAALALARRGVRVLGLEAGARGHEQGSSGGRSRMIRRAYFEDLAYIPLLSAAFDGWAQLEAESGLTLVERTGGVYLGARDGELVAGSLASARQQRVEHELIDADEIVRRWPMYRVADDTMGLVDPGAGFIRPEVAIETQLRGAEALGAELRFGERVLDWRAAGSGGGVEVETAAGTDAAAHVVLASGAWTASLLPDLALPLRVERVPVVWFEPRVEDERSSLSRLPVWIYETDFDGAFYGFPTDAAGLKVARHHSGDFVADADSVDRTVRAADVDRVRAFARRHLPAADGDVRETLVCLYTTAPDLHFVVDVHPSLAGVAFASACSGHGFKFAPAIGEVLADLALTGETRHAIEPFRADRFAARLGARRQ